MKAESKKLAAIIVWLMLVLGNALFGICQDAPKATIMFTPGAIWDRPDAFKNARPNFEQHLRFSFSEPDRIFKNNDEYVKHVLPIFKRCDITIAFAKTPPKTSRNQLVLSIHDAGSTLYGWDNPDELVESTATINGMPDYRTTRLEIRKNRGIGKVDYIGFRLLKRDHSLLTQGIVMDGPIYGFNFSLGDALEMQLAGAAIRKARFVHQGDEVALKVDFLNPLNVPMSARLAAYYRGNEISKPFVLESRQELSVELAVFKGVKRRAINLRAMNRRGYLKYIPNRKGVDLRKQNSEHLQGIRICVDQVRIGKESK